MTRERWRRVAPIKIVLQNFKNGRIVIIDRPPGCFDLPEWAEEAGYKLILVGRKKLSERPPYP